MTLTRAQLEALGYVEVHPGTWARPDRRLGRLPAALAEPAPGGPLEPKPPQRCSRTTGLGACGRRYRPTVTLVVHRRRLLPDGDNLVAGCKHLRDAIAAWLGLDDADAQVAWEYAQVATGGAEGVVVSISP
ncbi:MAG: hypothetical protein M5U12_06525 [Verrucomicrobia bacterium]|nr:hypothetical protein [Verrucomicrobiota bacterium]